MEIFAQGYCFQDLVRVPVQIEWIFMKILLTNLPDQICHISHTLNIQNKWIYSAIYSVTRFQVELGTLEGMDHIISSQLLLLRLLKYKSTASTLATCNIYVLILHQCRNTCIKLSKNKSSYFLKNLCQCPI